MHDAAHNICRGCIDNIDSNHIFGWFTLDDKKELYELDAIKLQLYINNNHQAIRYYFYTRNDLSTANMPYAYAFAIILDKNFTLASLLENTFEVSFVYNEKKYILPIFTNIQTASLLQKSDANTISSIYKLLNKDVYFFLNAANYEMSVQHNIDNIYDIFTYIISYGTFFTKDKIDMIIQIKNICNNLKVAFILLYLTKVLDHKILLMSNYTVIRTYITRLFTFLDKTLQENITNSIIFKPQDFMFVAMQKDEGMLLLVWVLYYIQMETEALMYMKAKR